MDILAPLKPQANGVDVPPLMRENATVGVSIGVLDLLDTVEVDTAWSEGEPKTSRDDPYGPMRWIYFDLVAPETQTPKLRPPI